MVGHMLRQHTSTKPYVPEVLVITGCKHITRYEYYKYALKVSLVIKALE